VIVHNGLLAMLAHDIYMDLIKPRPCDREDYCLKIASKLMKYASSSLYLSSFTEQELDDMENELDTLFKELKDVLKEQINITSWLDEESRNIMLDKLSNMTIMVPSSRSILLNSKFLNSYFLNNLNFTTHFDNAIELLRQGRNHLYSHVGINTSEPEAMLFFSLPSDIHPISVYELNTVFIPYGMVGSRRLASDLPSYVLKARVGNEIARQIVHHFDTTGVKYNAIGKDDAFLKGKSNDSYVKNYITCEEVNDNHNYSWINQRNNKYIYQVNAARTMNEHITDNSALWLTYKLYNKTAESEPFLPWLNMNHGELYLLLVAQEFCAKAELLDYIATMFETEHSPPHLRVKKMIENSALFEDVYKCKSRPKCGAFPREI
ncbi:hypothetical protein L9F63_007865, partial [Diploptera punctata]